MVRHKNRKTRGAEKGEQVGSHGGLSGEGDTSALTGTKDEFMP